MNRCLTTPELSQFLEGELDAAFMAEVESHLETCGVCQSALERMLDSEWHSSIAPATEGLGHRAWELRRIGNSLALTMGTSAPKV